jgi:preprotein translocase subunit SecD
LLSGGVILKSLKWRAVVVGVVLVAALVYLLPTLSSNASQGWARIFPDRKINLGLDLQGGMHLILEVQADKAVEGAAERMVDDLRETLRNERIPFSSIKRVGSWNVEIQLPADGKEEELRKIVAKDYPNLQWMSHQTTGEATRVILTMGDDEVQNIRKLAVAQALETIRNRIDQFGVTEPDIRPEGQDRILVQLPGIQDPQRAVAVIGKTALLEFKLVAEEEVTAEQMKERKLPPGVSVYPMRSSDATTGRAVESEIVLRDRTIMTGEYITNAQVSIDQQYNTPYVALEFDAQGGRLFERVTEANVKKRLAIVLDGVVYSAPVIQEKISGGRASITGTFSMDEARDLAIVLRAGALPAPVVVLEERTVGPSLGQDSIRKGFISSLIGGMIVIVFMVIYYRMAGVIADFAVLLNVMLIMSGLAAFGATLTLPGIAGIALTIGMAVDANVLIYERIREELRLGKTPRAAVETGYDRATLTILDANVTTLIAAIVLFQFGTGPVRGFAVTLSIGLIANLFTAIIVTRIIFDYLLLQRRMRTLSI